MRFGGMLLTNPSAFEAKDIKIHKKYKTKQQKQKETHESISLEAGCTQKVTALHKNRYWRFLEMAIYILNTNGI